MQQERIAFLKTGMFEVLQNLGENAGPAWGKMNPHQMIEHLTDFFDVSTGKLIFPLVTPEEHLPKYKEFLYSDKIFRENTKAPAVILGEEPRATRLKSFQEANSLLHTAVLNFFNYFGQFPDAKTLHPVFGQLNFDEWVMLHYKHVTHHLRQFRLLN